MTRKIRKVCEKFVKLNKKICDWRLCICSKSGIITIVNKEIAIWGDGVFGRSYNMQLNNDGLMWALVKEKPEEGLWMKRVPDSGSGTK